jgi:hypothetical protein
MQRRGKEGDEGGGARTEVRVDGVHVGVVPLAGAGVAGAVAVCEQRRGVVGDEREEQHDDGSGHPAELRDGPPQREHPGADHRRDDVRARRPHRPCSTCNHACSPIRRNAHQQHSTLTRQQVGKKIHGPREVCIR